MAASPVAFSHSDFGEALQTMRLAGDGADVVVKVAGLYQFTGGAVEVAGEQGCFADECTGKRDHSQRTTAVGSSPQPDCHVDHFSVGSWPIQQIFGRAEVAIEKRVGYPRSVEAAAQLEAQSVEPFATSMGEKSLDRYEREHVPVLVAGEHSPPGFLSDLPRSIEIGAVPRQKSLREEDLSIVGTPADRDVIESDRGGVEIASHDRGTCQTRAQEWMLFGWRGLECFAIGADCGRLPKGVEQVGSELQEPSALVTAYCILHPFDVLQGVAVRADRSFSLRRAQDVWDGGGAIPRFEQMVANLRG